MAVVVAQQNRQAGTYQGALSQAGVTIPAGATRITASLVMSQADIDDPANSAVFAVEGDWGSGFESIVGPDEWVGGSPTKPGFPRMAPTFDYSTTSRPMPNDLRAVVTTNRRWSWGVDVTAS